MTDSKIIPYEEQHIQRLFREKKIVLAGGCFDILHYGHLFFFEKAKETGMMLVVALEPDEFIITRKKRQPIHSQKQRAQLLSHVDLVDYIINLPLFRSDAEYDHMVELIHPQCIAVTSGDLRAEHKKEQAVAVGGRIIEVDALKEFSSSSIIKRYETIFGD